MKYNNSQKIFIDRVSNDCLLSDNKFVKIYNFFVVNNYLISNDINKSEIIILDLCWVNNNFLNLSEEKIKNYLSLWKIVILLWCISKKFKDINDKNLIFLESKFYKRIEKYFSFNIWIDNLEYLNLPKKISIIDTDNEDKQYSNYLLKNYKNKAFIEISYWCQLNCSYCNIKKIKWNTESKKIDFIINEIKINLDNWKNEIYLLSDECWSYWMDIWESFPKLLENIFLLSDNIKIHITNIYPLFLIKFYDDLKKYFYSNKIAFLLVPIQHTSDKILSLMNRKYNLNKLFFILDDIKRNSNTEIHNHIIFNYYNETLEDFISTFNALKYYDKTFYFNFSDINWLYEKNIDNKILKDKIVLLKKAQNKFNIDISF